ncbi:MAG: hypothetical protein D6732_26370 [Methanobacteriota archaeon]|nr:MAG: hypothetical protein D6732_26370 [Euryarchaeota archaeon]
MKRILALLPVLLVVFTLASLNHVDAEAVTVGFQTQISLETPSIVTEGIGSKVNISVSEPANGLSPIGKVDFYVMEKVGALGRQMFDQTILMSSPSITWTASGSYNISGFRLPIHSVQIPQYTEWQLKENGNTVVVGQISGSQAQMMYDSSKSLWLLFGSSQTDGNIYTNTFYTLKLGKTYSLILNALSYANEFTFPAGDTGSPMLVDLDTNSSVDFSFDMIRANEHRSYTQSLGFISINWIPKTLGTNWVIASYSGTQSLFLPSINITKVEALSSLDTNIVFPPVTAMQTSTSSISVSFEISGLPLTQATVDFFLMRNYFWTFIGQETTDYGGIATLNLAIDYPLGEYPLKAVATDGSNEFVGLSTLTVIQPTAKILVSYSTGYFGTGLSANSTLVDIAGTLQTSWGVPLENQSVVLFRNDGVRLSETITDAFGNFAFQYLHNGSAGSYSSFVYLVHNNTLYDTPISWIDVNILKGTPQIIVDDVVYGEYLNQTLEIGGSIVKPNGLPLDTSISLQFYDTTSDPFPIWVDVESVSSQNGSFVFSIPNPGVGTFQYRIVFSGDMNYNMVLRTISVTVNKSLGMVTHLDGFGTSTNPIPIFYNHGGDFSFNITSSSGLPVTGAQISVLSPSLNGSSTFEVIASGYSDSNGIFQLVWLPPDSYIGPAISLQLSGFSPYLLVKVTHENFTVPDTKLYWNYTGLGFTATHLVKNYYYSFTQSIEFSVTDTMGKPVKDGTLFTLTIGNDQIQEPIANGIVSFLYTFTQPGLLQIQLIYSPDYPTIGFPYHAFSMNLTISIERADVELFGTNYQGLQGETLPINVTSRNMQGTPLPGVTLELWYFTGIWRQIQTPILISDENGTVEYRYFIDLPSTGLFSFEWRVIGDANVKSTTLPFTVEVTGIITSLNLTAPTEYRFSELQFASATLKTALDVPLENKEIVFRLGNFTWSELTDVNGNVVTQLPLGMLPGTYTLLATFNGDGANLNSSTSQNVVIHGVNTVLSLVNLPPRIIYAEFFNFTVKLTDDSNNPLINKAVRIFVNGNPYLGITDAYGEYVFNEVYLSNDANATIEVFFDGVDGYNSSSYFTSLQVYKHALQVAVDIDNAFYDQDIQLHLTVNSTKGSVVSNVSILVFLEGQLLLNGTTNDFGILNSTIRIDATAGRVLLFQIEAHHANFSSGYLEQSVVVQRAPIQTSLTTSPLYFLTNSSISFSIVDAQGKPVKGLLVTVSYNYGLQNHILGQIYTNAEGIALVSFLPTQIGLVDILFSIDDPQGNYIQIQSKKTLEVFQAPTSISSSIASSGEFNAGILANVSLSTTTFVEVNVSLEAYINGEWLFLETRPTTNGKVIFSVPSFSNNSFVLFRTTVSTIGFENSSTTILAQFLPVNIEISDEVVEAYDIYTPQVNISTINGSLDFYYMDLYLINSSNNSDIFWGTVFMVKGTPIFIENGSFFDMYGNILSSSSVELLLESVNIGVSSSDWLNIVLNSGLIPQIPLASFPLGDYTVRLVFPSQGWFSEAQVTFNLRLIPEKLVIGGMDLNIENGTVTQLTIPVMENEGIPVSGPQIYIQVYFDNAWITIGEGLVSNGSASVLINSSLPFGTFPLRYYIPKSSYYAVGMVEKVITISKATELIFQAPNDLTIVYSDGVTLVYLLRLHESADPLANETIILSVYEQDTLVAQYFGVTNSSGQVIFENVLSDLIPGHNYLITAEFAGSSVLTPSYYEISNPEVRREEVSVSYLSDLSIDYGPGANQTIAVGVLDENFTISSGSIYWAVYYKNGAGVWLPLEGYSGFVSLDDQNPVLFVFNLTGEYQLHVEYVNDNSFYYSREGLILPFGWINEEATILSTTFSSSFPINGSITIGTQVENSEGYPLPGIIVEVWTPFGNYSGTTDVNGYVEFLLSPDLPGTFNLIFHIPQQGSISEKYVEGTLEITLLDIGFEASIDDVYWDEFIQINLNDSIANSSTYELILEMDGTVIFQRANLTFEELVLPFQLMDGMPGSVDYNLTRYNPWATSSSVTGTFELLSVPVEISVSYSVANGSVFVIVDIRDGRTSESIQIPYSLTVSNRSETITIEMNRPEFVLPADGNLTVSITVAGRYVGSTTQTIFIESSIPFTKGTENQSILDIFSTDFFAIVFLITGGSSLVIVQKRKGS